MSGDQSSSVPPLSAIAGIHQIHSSNNSYDRHIAASYTDQGLSKMFNE